MTPYLIAAGLVVLVGVTVLIAHFRTAEAHLEQVIGICFRCQTRPSTGNELYCPSCRAIVASIHAEPIEKQSERGER